MMRFIMPIVIIVIAVAVFFVFANPLYNDISALKTQVASYNEALDNSKALENARDSLTAQENAINPDNLAKIQKLLPENVDNIRLILEIGQIALPYGMVLKNVKYNATDTTTTAAPVATGAVVPVSAANAVSKDYGIFNLEFSISGSYDNFINFTKDLEKNLRIVDVSSITFSSDATASVGSKAVSSEIYNFDFKIRTYWLKN
jgi:Tfp pilus assembly protein PilO